MAAKQVKQAALRIAALAEADRAWVLARLSGQERAELQPLLTQLERLGARLLQSDLMQLSEEAAAPTPEERSAGAPELAAAQNGEIGSIAQAKAAELLPVLAELPAACGPLIAQYLPPGRRHVLGIESDDSPRPASEVSAALRTALIEVVQAGLKAHAPAAALQASRGNLPSVER